MGFRYKAFISYSRDDEEVADWLHTALEDFKVPNHIADMLGSAGSRLSPIFRDREDLAASGSLTSSIETALSDSEFLIVICSPASTNSHWVAEEIRYFRQLQQGGNILCLIAGQRQGESPFPAALMEPQADGAPREEPLAADMRQVADGKADAFLKLAAGLLGVDLDELRQRDLRKRHRRMAIVSGASVFGMLIAIGLALFAFNAQQRAEASRQAANRVVDAMIELIGETYGSLIRSSESLRSPGDTDVLQNEPLRFALNRTQLLVERTLVDDAEASVRILRLQGTTNGILGRDDVSVQLLEEALALARAENLGLEQMQLLSDLAAVHQTHGNTEAGLQALDAIRQHDDFAGAPVRLRAEVFLVDGMLAARQNRYDDARALYSQAIELLESEVDVSLRLGNAYWLMGDAWLLNEETNQAIPWLQKSIDLFIELEGPDFYGLQRSYSAFGWAQQSRGDYEAALRNYELARDVVLRNFGAGHRQMANEVNNIAMALNRLGQYDEAAERYAEAINLWSRAAPVTDQYRLAGMYSNLGNANANRGAMSEATQNYEQGLRMIDLSESPDRRMRSYLYNNLGDHLVDLGDTAAGIEYLERAVDEKSQVFGEENISTTRSRVLLARAYAREARFETASAYLADAERIYVATYADEPHMLAYVLEAQADLAIAQGRYDAAQEQLVEAHRLRQLNDSTAPADIAKVEVALGELLAIRGEREQALEWVQAARPRIGEISGAQPLWVRFHLLVAELGGDLGAAISVESLRETIFDKYPNRTDWQARLEAL